MVRWATFKKSVIGRPLASDELHEQLLPKTLALPVFASDPLSSVAYATEEAMLVLALAGAAAFVYITPISFAIAALLLIVIISYRQTIHAYPDGGGGFIVSLDNLGMGPAMVAGAALLTDYTLTVSVSVSAGVAALTSALPALLPWRVGIAVGLVILLTLANLRGVKESSTFFALPTYAFVATVFVTLITGLVQCFDGTCPQAASSGLVVEPRGGDDLPLLDIARFRLRVDGAHRGRGDSQWRPGIPRAEGAQRGPHPRDHGRDFDNHVPRDLHPGASLQREGH